MVTFGWISVMNDSSACVSGWSAGASPGVLAVVEGLGDVVPLVRHVAVEVDAVCVLAGIRCLPVGVHAVDDPQVDAGRDRLGADQLCDLDPFRLVAVDHADQQHGPSSGGAQSIGSDVPAEHRLAEHACFDHG